MHKTSRKIMALWLAFSLAFSLPAPALAASAQEDTVSKQIEFTRERMTQHKNELSALYSQFAANPSPALYAKTRQLASNINKEKGILDSLALALREARESSSWKALVNDMTKESSVLSAGAVAIESVYNAGRWVFGPSLEDIYGPTWREIEGMDNRLVEEARKVREEAGSIAKGLEEIKKKIEAGEGGQEIVSLQNDMVKRLNELQERKDKIKDNLQLMVRIYKAEKQNLPAATVFWGDTMGRYIDQVLKEVDLGRLVDMAIDIAEGNLIKPLVKLIKPMIKTAIGDYLAKARGGAQLTPEIIDDLVFSILFKAGGGAGGVSKALEDKLKSKVTGKLIEGVVVGTLKAEALVLTEKAKGKAFEIMKNEIAKLPIDSTFTGSVDVARQTANQLAKENAKIIQANATQKINAMKKTGKMIKDLWDLVFKDAVQAYLNSGTFTDAVKAANEACQKWREDYRKIQNDMIATEDEYVNSKWFSGGRTLPEGVLPPEETDPLAAQKKDYENRDPDNSAKTLQGIRDFVKEVSAPESGGTDLGSVTAKEDEMFELVLSGRMPSSAMRFINPVPLTSSVVSKPCTELGRRHSQAYMAKSAACDKLFGANTIQDWERCKADLGVLSAAQTKEMQECLKQVSQAYLGFAENRTSRLREVFKKIEDDYRKKSTVIRNELEPAIAWASAHKTDLENLNSILEKIKGLPWVDPLDALPDLPGALGAKVEATPEYDQVKNSKRLENIRQALAAVKDFDGENVRKILDQADFSWEDMNQLIQDNPWATQFGKAVVYEVKVDDSKAGSSADAVWASVGSDMAIVQYASSRDVKDARLAENIQQLFQVNPDEFSRLAGMILQIPVAANPGYYGPLAGFSLDMALSKHRQALAAYQAAQKASADTQQKLQEFSAQTAVPGIVEEILNFYRIYFEPWSIIRLTNPSLAAKRLMQDTEAFKKTVENFEKKYQAARQAGVQTDPDILKQRVEALKAAVKNYEKTFDDYYVYVTNYFPEKAVPLFTPPDLSSYEVSADTAGIDQQTAAQKFMDSAKALEAMKKGLQDMERADRALIAGQASTDSARAAIVQRLQAFAQVHRENTDLVLAEIQKAKKEYEGIQGGFGIFDHELPEKLKKALLGAGRRDHYQDILNLEEKFSGEQKKKQDEKSFSDYRIVDARVNTYSLAGASGDVALLADQLRQGKILITASLSHSDGIDQMFMSEDGGRTWREIPVNQYIQYEISPLAGMRYEPVLKIKTKLLREFQLRVFENISALVFQNVPFQALAQEAVTRLAEAYEQQNFAAFSDLVSRDFIGNRVFLEEGARFDFDLFTDIKLRIFIDRIEKRGGLYVAETHWEKNQVPRKTGQQQKTTGKTVMMFVLENGKMKIKNMRGNLLYATLSPEIAEASGLPSATIETVKTAHNSRNPVQPGAGATTDSGGTGSAPVTGNGTMTDGGAADGFNFTSRSTVDDPQADIYLEINIIWPVGAARIQAAGGSFNSITEAPATGYGTANVPATVGAVYVFITNSGDFGKMEILTSDGVPGGTCTFRYAVQTDGGRNLAT